MRRETVREHLLHLLQPRRFERLQVLDRVSFDVRRGEAVGIMGRNGSGKSTLLKIMSGVYQPDAGRVTIRAEVTPILELGVGWNPARASAHPADRLGMGSRSRSSARTWPRSRFAELERFAHELKPIERHVRRLALDRLKAVRDVLISRILRGLRRRFDPLRIALLGAASRGTPRSSSPQSPNHLVRFAIAPC